MAREHSCLIDEYDQISRDFEPFYQLAKDDPAYFKKMVAKASPWVQENGRGMKTGVFAGGKFTFTDEQFTLYTGDWPRTFGRFESFMPNMSIILNGRDEPRVVFNYRLPDARHKALSVSDPTPFQHSPRPTASYFKDEMKCLVPSRPKGFTDLANDASACAFYVHCIYGALTEHCSHAFRFEHRIHDGPLPRHEHDQDLAVLCGHSRSERGSQSPFPICVD